MQTPLSHRRSIPFFCTKSEAEFRSDPYERYDPTVLRQTALHLADILWGHYPFQAILDWMIPLFPPATPQHILEVGCGVGRLIGSIAQRYPTPCWGIDYSYQLLHRAQEYWVAGKSISLDASNRGLGQCELSGLQLANLSFGLAKAEALPFEAASQEVVCSSFLLDRVEEPEAVLREMWRVLRPGGRLLLVSPLNFQRAAHWEAFFPPERLRARVAAQGWNFIDWKTDWTLVEPLDQRGNAIHWQVLGMALEKK